VSQRTISSWTEDFSKLQDAGNLLNLTKEENANAWHVTDFPEVPIYNVWGGRTKSKGETTHA